MQIAPSPRSKLPTSAILSCVPVASIQIDPLLRHQPLHHAVRSPARRYDQGCVPIPVQWGIQKLFRPLLPQQPGQGWQIALAHELLPGGLIEEEGGQEALLLLAFPKMRHGLAHTRLIGCCLQRLLLLPLLRAAAVGRTCGFSVMDIREAGEGGRS